MLVEGMRPRLTGVVAVLLLAGCLGTPDQTQCTGDACPTGSSTTVPPTSSGIIVLPPIEYPVAVNHTVQFEGCTGGVGIGQIPIETARKVVPEDFIIDAAFGFVPDMAWVQFVASECSRIAVNTTIVQQVSSLRVGVFVTPRAESWRDAGVHAYVLDLWTSSTEMVAWLAPTRLPAATATFARTFVPAPSAPNVETWSVDSQSCDASLNFHASGQNYPPDKGSIFLWYGAKPYTRIDGFNQNVVDRQADASAIQLEGQCETRKVFEEMQPHLSQVITSYNETWTITGKTFE